MNQISPSGWFYELNLHRIQRDMKLIEKKGDGTS